MNGVSNRRRRWAAAAVTVLAAAAIAGAAPARAAGRHAEQHAESAPHPAHAPHAGHAPHAARAGRDPQRAWCSAHEAYEDECFICHPELREKGRLWCNEHGRYEDRCWLCHPELREEGRPYCEKHFLYEDECHLCEPERKKPAASDGAPGGGSAARLWCDEHGVAEDECGICHPELATELGHGRGVKIRFASREAARKAGIETARPRVEAIASGVECAAEIVYDADKAVEITAPVAGVVERVDVDLGARVRAGDVLAAISSAEIAAAANEAVLAQQTLERERRLHAQRVSALKEVQAAEAAYRTARQRLRVLGFTDDAIDALARGGGRDGVLELRAPIAGEVVERSVTRGARVETGQALARVADRSTMWAQLAAPESELPRVQVGQDVELTLHGAPERTFRGTVTWVAPGVDERTRRGRARVEVRNADGALRANAFAHARILTASSDRALVVPRSAIQYVGDRPFAFVELGDDLFEARALRLGALDGDRVEVLEGVGPEDEVVVAHSFLVKSQLQISRLGAGCAH